MTSVAARHPSEFFLLIEVADTSLAFDCGVKALAYARSGIAEYWVLDVQQSRKLHVFRSPTDWGYQSEFVLAETLQISPVAFSDCTLEIKEMLPLIAA